MRHKQHGLLTILTQTQLANAYNYPQYTNNIDALELKVAQWCQYNPCLTLEMVRQRELLEQLELDLTFLASNATGNRDT